ncbi:MAG: DNA repair protein RecN [Clostridia bacterium]|nr:DNA repair protein RecN [Clostridia bacterium]
MLQYLHIENIAVIEQANIEFSNGFNVLTGETGAGKSIIIDSLFAILGERTSRELIRHGCDRAVVSASFIDIGDVALNKLNELGYTVNHDEELIIQRVLFADGRGQVKINSQPANVSTLKEIGKLLINIHGQHDNQTLLDASKHISFIDSYAENGAIKNDYLNAFMSFRDITKRYNSISAAEEEKREKSKLLRYEIDELEKADIKAGETEDLKQRISIAQQSKRVLAAIKEAKTALSGTDDTEVLSSIDLLNTAARALSGISEVYGNAKPTFERLTTLALELEAAADEIEALSDGVSLDPEELLNCQNRLDMIYDLMLKYGNTEQDILDYLEKAKAELLAIESDEKELNKLEGMLKPAEKALIDAGAKLTTSRQNAAKKICQHICSELSFLDFNGAQFLAEISNGKYTKNGCDYTEFLISANVGEVPKPLVKIASGGELSRIMLAIRSVLSLKDDVGTLIFDEIDSGISGHAAHKVAVKLYSVAKKRQVICVTHLAQIAAAADRHLFISKSVNNGKTFTEVTELDHDGKVREIARIMSGTEYTENLLKTAEELISQMKQ